MRKKEEEMYYTLDEEILCWSSVFNPDDIAFQEQFPFLKCPKVRQCEKKEFIAKKFRIPY
jgi:hypothetical protein